MNYKKPNYVNLLYLNYFYLTSPSEWTNYIKKTNSRRLRYNYVTSFWPSKYCQRRESFLTKDNLQAALNFITGKLQLYHRKTPVDSGQNSALWPSPTITSHITPTGSSGSFVLSGNQELLLLRRPLHRIFTLRITVTKTASDLTAFVLLRPLAPLLDHCFRLDVGFGSIQLTLSTSLVRPFTSPLTKLTLFILLFFFFFKSTISGFLGLIISSKK